MPVTRTEHLHTEHPPRGVHVVQSACRAVILSAVKVDNIKQKVDALDLILHLLGENAEVRLRIWVVTKLEHIFQIGACHDLLCPSPRFNDAVHDLLVCSDLLQNPRSQQIRVACQFPCVDRDGATPAAKFYPSLHAFLVLSDAYGHERVMQDAAALLP